MGSETRAIIAWCGSQIGFINEPQSHLTYYHNPEIDPRIYGLNFCGESYLCIPADEARELLTGFDALTDDLMLRCELGPEEAHWISDLGKRVRALLALLPKEAAEDVG